MDLMNRTRFIHRTNTLYPEVCAAKNVCAAIANKHRRKSAYTLIVQSMILPITCEVMVHFRVDGLYRSPLGSMGALK